jgi:hypothetical protein
MIDELTMYAQSDNRVCPLPPQWTELWEMLPNRRPLSGGGWSPPPPLILAGWWTTSVEAKRARLVAHLEYARQHGILAQVGEFLRALPTDAWAYERDFRARRTP